MSLICTIVTSTITQAVLVPANTWVSQQQQQCGRLHWWDPRSWFCWFVTVLVLVVFWVTQYIVVTTMTVVCTVITYLIGLFILPFAWAIDAVCQTCTAVDWTNHWFLTHTKITFVSSAPSATQPGYSDYTFTCNCPNGSSNIIVTALNDNDAASQAKLACAKAC